MITYLWVALGSALGGVARFGIGNLVAAAWGTAFPWGTLLINIGGSFVIGFFGTLTAAADGRFAVPADARAFVMVGLCGGFTTFSSFSLQTLDLLRDGRLGGALANIGLSVLLCVAAVTVGHQGAAALSPGRVVATAGQAGAMPGRPRLLALLHRPEAAPALLATTARLLVEAGGGRLEALALIPTPSAPLLPAEEVATAERAEGLAAGPGAALRAAFDALTRLPEVTRGRIACSWTEIEGDPAALLARRARGVGLVVLERPGAAGTDPGHVALHAALFDAGCPLLMLPPDPAAMALPLPVAAVAWTPDGHAGRAVRSALPLLHRNGRVVLLHVEESGQAASQATGLAEARALLAEAGIPAEAVLLPPGPQPVGGVLLDAARQAGAGLLVMGAHGHGPVRERLLGGATRQVLAEAGLPVLMQR